MPLDRTDLGMGIQVGFVIAKLLDREEQLQPEELSFVNSVFNFGKKAHGLSNKQLGWLGSLSNRYLKDIYPTGRWW